MSHMDTSKMSRSGSRRKRTGAVKLSRPFTINYASHKKDPVMKEIMEKDLKGLDTPLKLMKRYAEILNKKTSYGDIDKKLDKLFLSGKTPRTLDGFYHGITLGMKTGLDSFGRLGSLFGGLKLIEKFDPLQIFYGRLLSKTSPWAGKRFTKLTSKKLRELTGGFDKGRRTAYLGINSFRKDNNRLVNNIAGYMLSAIIDMEGVPAPAGKQRSWIYAKGGLFIAKRQMSVDPNHPRKEVVALNYRWKSLGNEFPNKLLIDEIVEIAKGLYLGKLYYATDPRRLIGDFDPRVRTRDYRYRNFGYFLLMDDTWLHEKNMLFPELTYELADNLPKKFGTFRHVDTQKARTVKRKVGREKTVLHYLQELSRGVMEGGGSEQKCLKEINDLFLSGERPDGIQGFFHGGVVALNMGGLLKSINYNILNELYPIVRLFSPWTGKTFNEISLEETRGYIGADANYYKGKGPLILGTNTYRKGADLSLPATALIENLDKIGMVVEPPNEKEKEEEGIDVKSFYFIANFGKAVSPGCKGKKVLQFNYRWPKLHTMPPDNLCIDELVRIADGLYLGQLLYSTKPALKYDPGKDPAAYKYENFGYFMLMDDEWQAIKEFLAFDTESGGIL